MQPSNSEVLIWRSFFCFSLCCFEIACSSNHSSGVKLVKNSLYLLHSSNCSSYYMTHLPPYCPHVTCHVDIHPSSMQTSLVKLPKNLKINKDTTSFYRKNNNIIIKHNYSPLKILYRNNIINNHKSTNKNPKNPSLKLGAKM